MNCMDCEKENIIELAVFEDESCDLLLCEKYSFSHYYCKIFGV